MTKEGTGRSDPQGWESWRKWTQWETEYISAENELGVQVFQHFQEETARLQNQTDILVEEIQQLKQERDQQSRLAVPSSRVGHESIFVVCHHLERHPTTHESSAWIPTGPRVPSGPLRSAVHLRLTLADLLRRKHTLAQKCLIELLMWKASDVQRQHS